MGNPWKELMFRLEQKALHGPVQRMLSCGAKEKRITREK
jgi:hypothetical protein